MERQLTLGSLFDGIAGFPLAAVRQGIKPVWASEIEQDCVDITAKQFPDMQQLGDITKLKGADIPTVDIISFGSPCQNMLAGEKILEIRKTAPTKKDQEYRVLVYVTGGGGVCGEFICTDFMKIKMFPELKETHTKQSCLTENQIREYAGESKKNLWGWAVTEVKEYYTPHPLGLYGLKKPPQSWCYYKGDEVPDIMTINNLANICGYFYNAELDPLQVPYTVNNGYNCKHPEQMEEWHNIGCCYQWSCPLANIVPADEEDCQKYGLDYEESEFVLVYQKGQ